MKTAMEGRWDGYVESQRTATMTDRWTAAAMDAHLVVETDGPKDDLVDHPTAVMTDARRAGG